jgi:hypothetical protein
MQRVAVPATIQSQNPFASLPKTPSHTSASGFVPFRVEGISFILKFIMTSATVFLNSPQWLSIVLAGCSWYLLYLYLMWEPHLNKIVNQIRVASYAMVVYSSMMLIAVAFPPASVEKDDPDQVGVVVRKALTPSGHLSIWPPHDTCPRLQGVVHRLCTGEPR